MGQPAKGKPPVIKQLYMRPSGLVYEPTEEENLDHLWDHWVEVFYQKGHVSCAVHSSL